MLKTKILIVDDLKENIDALSLLLNNDNVETHTAMNADQALELITLHEFGLALLDVQMPGTSGFELAKLIRSVKRFRSLPIIFVTAHREDSSLIFEGYSSGAVDVLFKPLDANIVRAKVQMFVELAQQKALLQSHVRELERLRIEADAANIAKSQFLANMSHEIRTPLAAVMGFAELIARNQPASDENRELVSGIERNGALLLRLIDDILDLSKIEANRLELERTEFDFAEILHDIQTTLSFRAKEKGLFLDFKRPAGFPHSFMSDPTRIKQILLNIIGNAIKFTASGRVEVQIQSAPDGSMGAGSADRIQVQVTDQGVGLTHEQAERLFKPFGQADASTRRQFGGSGLGLMISRQIARALGGDIRLVSSQAGTGSTFLVELRLERAGATTTRAEPPADQASTTAGPATNKPEEPVNFTGKHILAVDDSPDNLTLVSLFLKGSGAEVSFAENGLKAIGEVRSRNFDLILMDVQMPGMDGNEATEEIRRLGYRGPIVALTAHAIRAEQEKCRKAGCNAVLTKPVTRAALLNKIGSHLSR
ncbi:MAG: response regulator [Bdellovibrionales bacterium]|nr:response regulator [Bdellovibrionales bacterium]